MASGLVWSSVDPVPVAPSPRRHVVGMLQYDGTLICGWVGQMTCVSCSFVGIIASRVSDDALFS